MARSPVTKKRRLSPPEDRSFTSASPRSSSKSHWDVEQTYENRPRSLKDGRESNRLPIKTRDGRIEHVHFPESDLSADDSDSFLGTSSDEDGEDEVEDTGEAEAVMEPPVKAAHQQIVEAKEELARLAELISEDPEGQYGVLAHLAEIASTDNVTVKKLAIATQAAVYKDVIPGYRIRPMGEISSKEKLSKDVRRLRSFEQALVHRYQKYIHDLAHYAKGSRSGASPADAELSTVAIACACKLLASVPHFNFRKDVIRILVTKLCKGPIDGDFARCRATLVEIFENDKDGNVSFESVAMITKMIKARGYNVHESVLNTFLHLRLLSELSAQGSYDRVEKRREDGNAKDRRTREKHEFRTKKQRKIIKEQKAIEKEMQEADAAVGHEERDHLQAETLKAVFVTYFRILKARSPPLMGAVLEGLARYAHLINQDFFGDILEALKDLINDADALAYQDDDNEDAGSSSVGSRNATRQSLLCVITAFALLQGQDAARAASSLDLDLGFFISHLYRTLHPVCLNPDIELGANSLRLPDPHAPQATAAPNRINIRTTTVLLLRSLASALSPTAAAAARCVPPLRVAAFAKQLLTASLHLPEKSCLAMTALLSKLVRVHGRKIAPLWNTDERRGDGAFDALGTQAESSNPFAATVWEGEILKAHYCPAIREALRAMGAAVVECTK